MNTQNPLIGSSTFAVSIQSHSKRSTGKIQVTPLREPERRQRALKRFGILFGLMIFSIFLPLVHFFLVPLLFFGSFAMGVITYRTVDEWNCDFACNECQAPLKQVILKRKYPLVVTCSSCGVNLLLRAV